MVSLAQMLANNKFSTSGFYTSYKTDGRREPTAVLGSVPAAWLCLCSPGSQGSSLAVLPWREVLQTEPVVSMKGTPPSLSRSTAENSSAPQGGSGRAFMLFVCVCLCVFFPWQKKIIFFGSSVRA